MRNKFVAIKETRYAEYCVGRVMGHIHLFGVAVPVFLIIWYLVMRSLMGYLRYRRDQNRREYQQRQEWYAKMEQDPLLRDFVRIARRPDPSYSTYSNDKPTHIRMTKERE